MYFYYTFKTISFAIFLDIKQVLKLLLDAQEWVKESLKYLHQKYIFII